jgi:putative photosynthetic complex assembly protein 2
MAHYGFPALYALFVWWFSTGIILYLDGMNPRTFRWSMLGATLLLALSLRLLATSSTDMSVAGAYTAFTFGLLAWGWQEISFYMGYVTGPRTQSCPEGCSGWRHFGHAIGISLYHELAILATAAAVFTLAWPGSNHIGVWTFVVLWWMHQSAKLNVFLGVRNVNEEFVPDHLAVLKSFLTRKPINLLFPVSVTISTVIAYLLLDEAFSATATAFEATGYTFLGTLMVLAILEHWLLVLPLPTTALWQWGLTSRVVRKPFDVEIVAGFLGAGKTSFMRRLLAAADPAVRTVVLVNDFGALGIDGSLLSGQGAEVVELPNGCICCSLRKDLARQLTDIVTRLAPQRILIEPSGVADLGALIGVLEQPSVKPLVKSLRICTIVDAANFPSLFNRMHEVLAAQISIAQLLIVNKTDLVTAAELRIVEATLAELNPRAVVLPARFGMVLNAAEQRPAPAASVVRPAAAAQSHEHETHTADEFTAWSTLLGNTCHPQGLQDLLDGVTAGTFGEIERVKGIARAGLGWVHFDVAGGRSTIAAFAPNQGEEPRVTAIGRGLDRVRLQAAFDVCTDQARA